MSHRSTIVLPCLAAAAMSAALSAQSGVYARLPSSTSCVGSSGQAPDLMAAAPPALGATFNVNVSGLPASPFDTAFMLTQLQLAPVTVPTPIPLAVIGMPGCSLGLGAQLTTPLVKTGTTSTWSLPISMDPALLGLTFFNQVFAFDRPLPSMNLPNALGAVTSDTFAGSLSPINLGSRVLEDFTSAAFFDDNVSSGRWGNGLLLPGVTGSDGIHGAFDITMLPMSSSGERIWDTDQPLQIPANRSLLGAPETVVGGQARFSEFVIPVGEAMRIVGSMAPVIRASGRMVIGGRLSVDGEDGAQPIDIATGGVGGAGGAGAGAGGRGADAWDPTPQAAPPPFATPTAANFGRDGEDLRVLATSGYAGMLTGTAGQGAPLFPASGLLQDVTSNVNVFYSAQQIAGGGGGGYQLPGASGAITRSPAVNLEAPLSVPAGGSFLAPRPVPSGATAYEHFLVGGSGGGGGGCAATMVRRSIQTSIMFRQWTNGHGGGGGGGAMALEAGQQLAVGLTGIISARGGSSRSSVGNGWTRRGTSVAGGGSGGTVYLRVGGTLDQRGTIDVSGGLGGFFNSSDPSGLGIAESTGGEGSPGRVFAESSVRNQVVGRVSGGGVQPRVVSQLVGVDSRSMARSRWYPLASTGTSPLQITGYQLAAAIDTTSQVFSDGSLGTNPANQPNAPVHIFLQVAQVDPVTQEPTGTSQITPWSDTVRGLPLLPGTSQAVRFLIFFDLASTRNVSVQNLEIAFNG